MSHLHWAPTNTKVGPACKYSTIVVLLSPACLSSFRSCLLYVAARLSTEEVDILLQKCEGGVEVALLYAKHVSKYLKDLIYYLEKRTALGELEGDLEAGLLGPAPGVGGSEGRAAEVPRIQEQPQTV